MAAWRWGGPSSLLACGLLGCVGTGDDGGPPAEAVEEGVRFRLPLEERERFSTVVGFDHDPRVATTRAEEVICADYLGRGFPRCYDEHDGSDFILDGGFPAMDAGSPAVVAAAAGRVVAVEDGHYDRCHGTLAGVDCDGHDGVANSVVLEHEGGLRTLYWHLQRGSVVVAVGEAVARGQVVGRVGSSGYSSMPHLHFEVQDESGASIDPFVPPGAVTAWWCDQGGADELPASDCAGR